MPPMMALVLARAGRIDAGLTRIQQAIAHSERTEELWLIAALLRVKGELLLMQDASGAAAAARIISGGHSIWRTGMRLCRGSCGARRASPGCLAIRVVTAMAWRCSSRSTNVSPKGSNDLIKSKRLVVELS